MKTIQTENEHDTREYYEKVNKTIRKTMENIFESQTILLKNEYFIVIWRNDLVFVKYFGLLLICINGNISVPNEI